MTTLSKAAPAVDNHDPPGVFARFAGWLTRKLARRAARRMQAQLGDLDDRLLQDIGITRVEFNSAQTTFRRGHGPF